METQFKYTIKNKDGIMALDLTLALSSNFKLGELLFSETAQRSPALLKEQQNPSKSVITNLKYLVDHTLQPLRTAINHPIRITSGYRCLSVNKLVGSTPTSQHLLGEAADIVLPDSFLTNTATETVRDNIHKLVFDKTGQHVRSNVPANFYLFAYSCLFMDTLDIDQVIHEYGNGFGAPAWVHVASSSRQNRLQILSFGGYVKPGKSNPTLVTALTYGTSPLAATTVIAETKPAASATSPAKPKSVIASTPSTTQSLD